jgi:hypothetical protein
LRNLIRHEDKSFATRKEAADYVEGLISLGATGEFEIKSRDEMWVVKVWEEGEGEEEKPPIAMDSSDDIPKKKHRVKRFKD